LLDIPSSISESDALDVIRKYAPLARLHVNEQHWPSTPERFRSMSRFRKSVTGPDSGWDCVDRCWRESDDHSVRYRDVAWSDVTIQSDDLLAFKPNDEIPSKNVRPRDAENTKGKFNSFGLFLQRQTPNDAPSGVEPSAAGEIHAPVFVDLVTSRDYVRVLYWLFYELNYYHIMITHQGDWEHVSLIFEKNDFCDGRSPSFVYLAQHNTSKLIPATPQHIGWELTTHPVCYVDRNGHPARAAVRHAYRYTVNWRTWECPFELISSATWHRFAGAWGEVGNIPDTTGPLGPFFKRNKDHVALVISGGKLCIKETRKG
jgi:hypothetical protein